MHTLLTTLHYLEYDINLMVELLSNFDFLKIKDIILFFNRCQVNDVEQ